jgi:hypothetical protein
MDWLFPMLIEVWCSVKLPDMILVNSSFFSSLMAIGLTVKPGKIVLAEATTHKSGSLRVLLLIFWSKSARQGPFQKFRRITKSSINNDKMDYRPRSMLTIEWARNFATRLIPG